MGSPSYKDSPRFFICGHTDIRIMWNGNCINIVSVVATIYVFVMSAGHYIYYHDDDYATEVLSIYEDH